MNNIINLITDDSKLKKILSKITEQVRKDYQKANNILDLNISELQLYKIAIKKAYIHNYLDINTLDELYSKLDEIIK